MPTSDDPGARAQNDARFSVRPPPRDPLAGSQFRMIQPLGAGSTGEVVEAEHLALHKRVVVKLLREELAGDPILIERMKLEAEALGRISPHPHIVEVTDVGTTPDGRPFIVMERLRGRTLRQELKIRGHLPVEEALDLGAQLLEGLEAAHRVGIVHRDIKPANLFLCDPIAGAKRTLKILDFGIAKVIASDSADAPSPRVLATTAGMAIGTPRFIAPEQALGVPVDPRADLYAVGAVLYAMLVGHDPFAHVSGFAELLRAHATELPEAPSKAAPQPISGALDALVLKALAKRPDDRFRDAADFAASLGAPLVSTVPRWLETERLSDLRSHVVRAPAAPCAEQPAIGPVSRMAAVTIILLSVLLSAVVTSVLVHLLAAKAAHVDYGAANVSTRVGGR